MLPRGSGFYNHRYYKICVVGGNALGVPRLDIFLVSDKIKWSSEMDAIPGIQDISLIL